MSKLLQEFAHAWFSGVSIHRPRQRREANMASTMLEPVLAIEEIALFKPRTPATGFKPNELIVFDNPPFNERRFPFPSDDFYRRRAQDMINIQHPRNEWGQTTCRLYPGSDPRYAAVNDLARALERFHLGAYFPIPWKLRFEVHTPQTVVMTFSMYVPNVDPPHDRVEVNVKREFDVLLDKGLDEKEVAGRLIYDVRQTLVEALLHEFDEHFFMGQQRIKDPHAGEPR